MRVLLLTPVLPFSADAKVPHHILQEIQFLAQLPLELHVLTAKASSLKIPGVTFHVMPQTRGNPLEVARCGWFGLRHGPGIRQYAAAKKNCFIHELINRLKIDIVHSHWAFPAGTGGVWAARAAGIPCIMTLRGVDINKDESVRYGYRLDPRYEAVLKRSLLCADRITVASTYSQTDVEGLIGRSDKTILLANGLDLDRFTPTAAQFVNAKREHGFDDEFVIFTLGQLVRKKRFDVVVAAMSLLRTSARPVRCLIAGEGPMRSDLQAQIRDESLDSLVTLIGAAHFDQVPGYYAACDAFVFASAAEGFGNVIVEAMAMAKPVVSTPVGVAKDIIEDGVNGFLFPFGDAAALAERLAFLMDHPDLARRIGDRARATVVPKISIQNRVQSFYDLYSDCIAERMAGR